VSPVIPRVSLIIRCHNEEAHIGRLLTGVRHQTLAPDEIVVVDSGSTDATLAIASAFSTRIVSIPRDEFSFGHALNVGMRESTGDLAVFASAHVYPVYDTWLERLIQPFVDDGVALSYGRQTAPPEGRFSEHQLLARWFPPVSVPRQRDPFCNNANAAVRRSVWSEIPFDEDLTGLEDLDWAKKALALGHVLSYVADAPIVHVHDESFAQTANRYRREAIAHKRIFNEQEISLATAVRLGIANIVGDARDALRQDVLRDHLFEIVKFRTAQFSGTYRGFRQRGAVTEILRERFYYPSPEEHHVTTDGAVVGRPIDYDEPLPSR
jgi:rhamnosyltransferase